MPKEKSMHPAELEVGKTYSVAFGMNMTAIVIRKILRSSRNMRMSDIGDYSKIPGQCTLKIVGDNLDGKPRYYNVRLVSPSSVAGTMGWVSVAALCGRKISEVIAN